MSDQGIPPRRPSGGFEPPGLRLPSGESAPIEPSPRPRISDARNSFESATQGVRRGLAELEDLVVETLASVESERAEADGHIRNLEREVELLRQQLSQRSDELEEARAELTAALQAAENADNSAAEAIEACEAIRSELELAEAERAAADLARSEAEEARAEAEGAIADVAADRDELRQELEAARARLDRLAAQLVTSEEELDALREEALEATQSKLDFDEQLAARDASIGQLEASLLEARARSAELEARLAEAGSGSGRHPSWPTGTPRAVPQRNPPSRRTPAPRRSDGPRPSTHEVLHELPAEDAERLAEILNERPLLDPHAVLSDLEVNSRAAYLLTRMDGSVSIRDLIDTAGMPRIEAAAILLDLHLREVF